MVKPVVISEALPSGGPLRPGDIVIGCSGCRRLVLRKTNVAVEVLLLDVGLLPVESVVLGADGVESLIDALEDIEDELENLPPSTYRQ